MNASTKEIEVGMLPDPEQIRTLRAALQSKDENLRKKARAFVELLPQDQYEVVMFGERT